MSLMSDASSSSVFTTARRWFVSAEWLNSERARGYGLILAVATATVAAIYIGLSSPLHDPLGKAIGTDFASFWTASRLALTGDLSGAWDLQRHQAAQNQLFGPEAGYAAFFYPPPFLLVCLPLALLPYAASLATWLTVTFAMWVHVVRQWAQGPIPLWVLLAFPAVLVNAGHGQNGFLTAALFGAGAVLADRRPWLSGIFFGALVIKPHLALLVPIFFLLTANWRGFIAAAVTAFGLCALSFVVLGADAWRGFIETSALARATLDMELVSYEKMQSVYAGARLLGASGALAWLFQATGLLGAVALLWTVRRADAKARGAALCCATVLATPFLLDYDLTLLAMPLVWLFSQARSTGFRHWERLVLASVYVLPLIARPSAVIAGLPLTPVLVSALALCVAARCVASTRQAIPLSTLAPVRP